MTDDNELAKMTSDLWQMVDACKPVNGDSFSPSVMIDSCSGIWSLQAEDQTDHVAVT